MAGVTNEDDSFILGDNLDQSSSMKTVVDSYGPSDVSKADADFNVEKQAASGPATRSLYVNGFLPGDGGLRDPTSNPDPPCSPVRCRFSALSWKPGRADIAKPDTHLAQRAAGSRRQQQTLSTGRRKSWRSFVFGRQCRRTAMVVDAKQWASSSTSSESRWVHEVWDGWKFLLSPILRRSP
jgi:hypothetical protein